MIRGVIILIFGVIVGTIFGALLGFIGGFFSGAIFVNLQNEKDDEAEKHDPTEDAPIP